MECVSKLTIRHSVFPPIEARNQSAVVDDFTKVADWLLSWEPGSIFVRLNVKGDIRPSDNLSSYSQIWVADYENHIHFF